MALDSQISVQALPKSFTALSIRDEGRENARVVSNPARELCISRIFGYGARVCDATAA